MSAAALVISLGLALAAPGASPEVTPGVTPVDEAEVAYQSGRLDEAQRRLEPLLYPLRLEDGRDELRARLLLAATYFASGDRYRAEEEVTRALARGDELGDPLRIDPLLFPPDFVAFAEQARARRDARLAERRQQEDPDPAPAQMRPIEATPPSDAPLQQASALEPRPEPMAVGLAFVPFGAPQFWQDRGVAGAVLVSTQATCLAASVSGLAGALSLRGDDGRYSRADAPLARTFNTAWVAGAWCFVGLYGAGVADALLQR